MMAATSALLLLSPVVFLMIALRGDLQRRAGVGLIALVFGLPAAVLILYSLLWRVPATRIVNELHGIAFRSEDGGILRKDVRERAPGSSRVVIGDVPARRRRIPQALFGTLVFRPRTDTTEARGTMVIELPPPEKRAGLIATSAEGILGAIGLEDGDDICIGGSCWKYARNDRSFSAGGQTFRIPPREAKIPGLDWVFTLPFARPISATVRTYALDALAHATTPAPSDRVRSFIAHTRRSREPLLVPLDTGVSVRRGGQIVSAARVFDVDAGDRITFYTLPVESPSFEAPGIVERRSMIFEPGQRSFALDFDTPEVHSLTTDELGALLLPREGEKEKKKVVALAMGDAQLVDRSLYFTGASEAVALQSSALVELSRFFPRDFRSSFRIVSPRGPTDAVIGKAAWIGASDLASVRLLVLRPPLLLLLLALVLQFLKVIAAAAARFSVAQLLFAGTIEILAGARLLFGHRVWSMPPHKLEGAELGLVAWMLLPWAFLAASLPVPVWRDLRARGLKSLPLSWASTLAGVLVSMTFCGMVVEGPRKIIWMLCHLIPFAVVMLRSVEVRSWLRAQQTTVQTAVAKRIGGPLARMRQLPAPSGQGAATADRRRFLVRIVAAGIAAFVMWLLIRQAAGAIGTVLMVALASAAAFFFDAIRERLRRLIDPELAPFVWWSIAFAAIRIILLLFGFKESMTLGGARISLSAAYVPAAAILQGFYLWRLWQRRAKDGRLTARELTVALLIITFVWAIPAVLTSDIGLALLNVPVLLLLLLAIDRKAVTVRVLIVLVVVVIAGAPLGRLALPLISDEETLLSFASDSNYARFFHFAAPERLRELATKRGESLAITSAVLQQYVNSGVFGHGYGRSEVTIHLGDTALRDFAPAVLVAGEWGLTGTVAMLLTYVLVGYVGYRITPIRSDAMPGLFTRAGAATLVTCVAAGTIAVSSIYMILANHELVLLTGKNAYLLGLDSAGDVLETFALAVVIAYGAASLRDAADMQPGVRG